MKANSIILILLLLLLSPVAGKAQFDPEKVCRFVDGKLVFTLNLQWTDAQRREIYRLFDLDTALYSRIAGGIPEVTVDSVTWNVKVIAPDIVEVSKAFDKQGAVYSNGNDLVLMDENWFKVAFAAPSEYAAYGVNTFSFPGAFQYSKENATFFLPGFRNAGKVYLSGSFNEWSTMQLPMKLTDTGWIVSMSLKPGKYTYKYIVDGEWKTDPSNKQKEDDTYNGKNSVVFCYNYAFALNGFPNARNVVVSGSFNNWNEKELKMIRKPDGWELPIFLREGTHAYKFIVDKEWITDPANKVTRPDGRGNVNSFMAIGDTLTFRLTGYKAAKQVILAGSFNAWNTGELFMGKDSTGWSLPYVLAKGNYEYKFIVDGKWMTDPENPYSTGSGDLENSFVAFKPNHTFELDSFPDSRKVIVTGSFNGWNTESYRMVRSNGRWIFPIALEAGKYTYKFIVDNNWMLDPGNELWEENEYNTHNSVIWIKP